MTERTPYTPPKLTFDDYAAVLRHKTDESLKAANFVLWMIRRPRMMKAGRLAARIGLALHVPGTVTALRATVFQQFCGGIDLDEAIERARRLHKHGIGTILDYAVENAETNAELDAVAQEIESVVDAAAREAAIDLVGLKVTGIFRFALLEKVSDGAELSPREHSEFERGRRRLDELADRANHAGVALFVDAEHSWVQPAINTLVEDMMRKYNRERAVVLTTVQLYLRGGLSSLQESLTRARSGNYRLGVKLVRGAYLERENERAALDGVPSPIQPSKTATDADYDKAVTLCLENLDEVTVCIATHNVESTQHMVADMARLGIPPGHPAVSTSQLLGMFDRITVPLAEHGYNVYKYVPYGGVRDALPYLMRRADENKSVADQLGPELEAVQAEMRRRGMRPL